MKILIIFTVYLLITGCGRPSVKNPEDIIADKAKAAIFIPKLKGIFEVLPEGLSLYAQGVSNVLDADKPAVIALTSLDPPQVYFALPVKEGQEKAVVDMAKSYFTKVENWSGYVFVALQGDIPGSYGNKKFLPESKDAIISGKVLVEELIQSNSEKIESYKKYTALRTFRSFLSSSQNKILTRFITHELVDILKDVKDINLEGDPQSFELTVNLKPESKLTKDINEMKDLTLPALPEKEGAGFEFSSAIDPAKISQLIDAIDFGLKTHLADSSRTSAIYALDDVFLNLKKSGTVKAVGSFNITENDLTGQAIIEAEHGESFFKSISIFYLKAFDYLTVQLAADESTLEGELLPLKSEKESTFKLFADTRQVSFVEKRIPKPSLELRDSGEKGIFNLKMNKIALKSTIFEGMNAQLKMTIEENQLKLTGETAK